MKKEKNNNNTFCHIYYFMIFILYQYASNYIHSLVHPSINYQKISKTKFSLGHPIN